jgi:hypothetical protein
LVREWLKNEEDRRIGYDAAREEETLTSAKENDLPLMLIPLRSQAKAAWRAARPAIAAIITTTAALVTSKDEIFAPYQPPNPAFGTRYSSFAAFRSACP